MKIYRTMLYYLIIAISMTYAFPAYAASWEDETGPYSTTVVSDTGSDKMFYIYRPQTLRSNTHPLAVFCVGTGSHPRNSAEFLTKLASHGVVVIAGANAYQSDGSQASAGVNWLIGQSETNKSEYYQKLVSGTFDKTVPLIWQKPVIRKQQSQMRGMAKILIKVILGLGAINLFNTIQEHGYTPTFLTTRGLQEDASTDQIGMKN